MKIGNKEEISEERRQGEWFYLPHGLGCACWECIGKLQAWIVDGHSLQEDNEVGAGLPAIEG